MKKMRKNFLENINKSILILVILGLTSHSFGQEIISCETLTSQSDQDSLKLVKEKLINVYKEVSIVEE